MSVFLQKILDKQVTRKDEKRSAANKFNTTAALDAVLVFDTTGSMYGFLEEVRGELSRLVSEINDSVPNARVGVIAYGDYGGDIYVTKVLDLTDNFNSVKDFVRSVERTGGGDFPEAVEEALYRANRLNWRIGSSRAVVLVGDAPPHGVIDAIRQYDYKTETSALGQKGVKIYATECGANDTTEKVFRWMARQTNGTYLKLENIRDLVDLLIGICMKEVGLLDSYMEKLQTGKALTQSKAKVFKQLKGSSGE